MSITVSSLPEEKYTVIGNRALVNAKITMGSVYPYGGESFDPEPLFGMHNVDLALINQSNGLSLQYDAANKKLKAYRQAPPIRYEEHHVADETSGEITLDYPAAWLMNAAVPEQNLKLRSTGIAIASLGDNECSLTAQMAAGVRTGLVCKSKLDWLGGEGAFTGAATNWTLAEGWAYGTNNIGHTGDGEGTAAHNNFAAIIGRTYLITYTISSLTEGTVTPSLGGVTGTAVGADGTYTEVFKATSTGGLAFTPSNAARFTLDSVTIVCLDVYVTYVTQAWKDVWENLVQDESVTLASGAATSLANAPLAIMYADRTSATAKALTLIDEDDTAASGEIAFYLNQATSNIKATHADENAKVAKVTYLKNPGSGFLYDRAFDNEAATKAGSDPYTNAFDYPILLWGYTGQMPVNGQATERIINYAGTPAAGECVIDWYNPGTRGAAAPASGTVVGLKDNQAGTGAGVWGTINEIVTQPLEVPDGEDLSAAGEFNVILIGI